MNLFAAQWSESIVVSRSESTASEYCRVNDNVLIRTA